MVVNNLSEILLMKEDILNNLLSELEETHDDLKRNNLALFIVENFKDDKILPLLIKLSASKKLSHFNGTLIYACGVYSVEECKKYLPVLIDLVINGEYEASWSASQIILDFHPPYEWDETLLEDFYNRLEFALQTDTKNVDFIKSVINKFNS